MRRCNGFSVKRGDGKRRKREVMWCLGVRFRGRFVVCCEFCFFGL